MKTLKRVLLAFILAASFPVQAQVTRAGSPFQVISGTGTSGNSAGFNSSGLIVDTGRNYATDGAKLDGLPASAYGLVGDDGSSMTARGRINLISGTGVTVSCADNSGSNSTDCTISSPGYTMQFASSAGSPADSTTYFIGMFGTAVISVASGPMRIVIPKAGTVKRIDLHIGVGGTLASGESTSANFRLNNTTDTLISSAVLMSASAQDYSATVSIAVAAGDYFEIKYTTPAWVTNPTNISVAGSIYIE